MKHFNFTILLTMLMSMVGAKAFAYDAIIDDIYYNFSGTEASVTYLYNNSMDNESTYTGDITIPESVTYEGNTYPVTSIGDHAFSACTGITSIAIPSSVTTDI